MVRKKRKIIGHQPGKASGRFVAKDKPLRCVLKDAATIVEIYPTPTMADYSKRLDRVLRVSHHGRDADALGADWQRVGKDMMRAYRRWQDDLERERQGA